MVITARAPIVALVAVVVIALSPRPATAFTVCATVLCLAVVVDALLAGRIDDLKMLRSGPPTVRLGDSVDTELQVKNHGRRRLRGQLRDAWAPSAVGLPYSHEIDCRPTESAVFRTRLRPVRRGSQQAATVTVRSLGPLGLAGRQRSQSVVGTVRASPPFLSRKHLPSRLARLREIDGQTPVLLRGHGTEFDSLREYVVGDDVRSIDWRATARRSDVVVRTWRPERDRRVVIVVDTGRTSAGRVGIDPTSADPSGWPRLEWCLDAALLLAALASRAGDHVDFLAHDRVTRAAVLGARRTDLMAQLISAMDPLDSSLVESDAAGLIAAIRQRVRQRAIIVVFTDLNPSALEEGLLPVLPQIAGRHRVIVAAVGDPRFHELAAGRSDAAQVYDAAAAERTLGERRTVAARLRAIGVDVVDADPEGLAPALADHYLALKAGGWQ